MTTTRRPHNSRIPFPLITAAIAAVCTLSVLYSAAQFRSIGPSPGQRNRLPLSKPVTSSSKQRPTAKPQTVRPSFIMGDSMATDLVEQATRYPSEVHMNWTAYGFTELTAPTAIHDFASQAVDSMATVHFGDVSLLQPLAGPLCTFLPANAETLSHETELGNVLRTWADSSMIVYTENASLALHVDEWAEAQPPDLRPQALLVNQTAWRAWHSQFVLRSPLLRRRGSTFESLRGRGQLSIPLFRLMTQLVRNQHPVIQNCKWFAKVDTDTVLRRSSLERTVLGRLDHTKALHVGVTLQFDTRPFNHTQRQIRFRYGLGGPGYAFSRELLRSVDSDSCLRSMALEPVLLVHDDVAMGYCSTYHAGRSRLVEIRTAVSSSFGKLIAELIHWSENVTRLYPCWACATSVHPVRSPDLALLLKRAERFSSDENGQACRDIGDGCEARLMINTTVRIGRFMAVTSALRDVFKHWPVGTASHVVHSRDEANEVALASQYRSQLMD